MPESPQRALRESRSFSSLAQLPVEIARLPSTSAEAEATAKLLERYKHVKPRVYLDDQAQESAVKAACGPQLLVMCTHGFVLDTPSPGKETAEPIENPLLRCGLLLAGASQWRKAKHDEEDGIFTGLEVVGTDLRGTLRMGQVIGRSDSVGTRPATNTYKPAHLFSTAMNFFFDIPKMRLRTDINRDNKNAIKNTGTIEELFAS